MLLPGSPTVWFHEPAPQLGPANILSQAIATAERRHPGIIPNLRAQQTLLIGSDYSGSHQTAKFDITSFLITNLESIGEWNVERQRVRNQLLPQQRRMSYKALNDGHRRAALTPFLDVANDIPGLLMSIAIDRTITTLFEEDPKARATYPAFAGWKPAPIERALRIIHLTSLMLRGLAASSQDVWWFTDQDEIVANEHRLRSFVDLTANISSHYLRQPMGHLRIGTTTCDTGRRDIEDYVAIPDIAAGTLQELLAHDDARLILDAPSLFVPKNERIAGKARTIMDWFSDNTHPLRRLTFVIDQPTPGRLRITTLRAHGSSDADAAQHTLIL